MTQESGNKTKQCVKTSKFRDFTHFKCFTKKKVNDVWLDLSETQEIKGSRNRDPVVNRINTDKVGLTEMTFELETCTYQFSLCSSST